MRDEERTPGEPESRSEKIERDLLFPEEVRRQGIKMSGQKGLESIQEQYRKLEKTVEIFREN